MGRWCDVRQKILSSPESLVIFTDWLLRLAVSLCRSFFFLVFFCFAEESLLSGVKIFVYRFVFTKKRTPWPSFFDILPSFGVKNVCAFFREIE